MAEACATINIFGIRVGAPANIKAWPIDVPGPA
jgi:hypothetical protein